MIVCIARWVLCGVNGDVFGLHRPGHIASGGTFGDDVLLQSDFLKHLHWSHFFIDWNSSDLALPSFASGAGTIRKKDDQRDAKERQTNGL